MSGLYPNLHEQFRAENVCPICMTEMANMTKYSCSNSHSMCQRCKQFYHGCPTCLAPLIPEVSMPQPYPPPLTMPQPSFGMHPYPPSAPTHDEFLDHERRNADLLICPYASKGCWAKFPKNLEDVHVARCQFRPHLEEDRQPTDLRHNIDDLVDCRYRHLGCLVRMPPWRRSIHEEKCVYRDNHSTDSLGEQLGSMNLSGSSLLECRYKDYGCMAKMERHRKHIHEEDCRFRPEDVCTDHTVYTDDDENMMVECQFREHGCKVKVPIKMLMNHEARCPYNVDHVAVYASDEEEAEDVVCDANGLVPCRFRGNGCIISIPYSRKLFHEERCMYKDGYHEGVVVLEEGNGEECGYVDEDGKVRCRYWTRGCRVKMAPQVRHSHEERCNYQ